jgi:Retinal pigment epithelial membrane protein
MITSSKMETDFSKKLTQDPLFVKHCFTYPEEFQLSKKLDLGAYKILHDCLILSSAAFCDATVNNDHLLDGYSWGLFVHISSAKDNTDIKIYCKKIQEDEDVRLREVQHTSSMKFGLFTGKLPTWRKWLTLGRLPTLLSSGRAVERTTAHQPIFYPAKSQVSFCSSYTYPSFNVLKDEDDRLVIKRSIKSDIQNTFDKKHYTCMHPLYDYRKEMVLTYTFLHSKLSRNTKIWFYSFGDEPKNDTPPIEYEISDRVALHMFGFTQNYYIIFANSLVMEKCGQTKLMFGKPILRATNDDYSGDLIIHLIPRYTSSLLKPFSVNTKQKGFVYHTINCFDHPDGSVIVDALVSKLNESRESSQFELGQEDVFDNEGDPFRFKISPPPLNQVSNKILASQIDTSIDFHCINPRYSGRLHTDWWMVSHQRDRKDDGTFNRTVSKLQHIKVDFDGDAMDYDPEKTVVHKVSSDGWNKKSVYLRTPTFVPFKYPENEIDGLLFCWSFEDEGLDYLSGNLLIYAPHLALLKIIGINAKIPYSVHSYVHLLSEADIKYEDE